MKIIEYGRDIKPKYFTCERCCSKIEYVNYEIKQFNKDWFYVECPICRTKHKIY